MYLYRHRSSKHDFVCCCVLAVVLAMSFSVGGTKGAHSVPTRNPIRRCEFFSLSFSFRYLRARSFLDGSREHYY